MKLSIFILAAALLTTLAQADPVQVTITGTADTTEMGYTQSQSYTFNWVVNDGFDGGILDNFSGGQNYWRAHVTSDPLLWSSISGDGLSGTYSRPSGWYYAPYDILNADSAGLGLYAHNDDPGGSTMGLTVDGTEVWIINAYALDIPGLDYSDTSFVNPASWLADYGGTHALSSGNVLIQDLSNQSISFTATSASINIVPEPASLGLLGLVSGGIYFARRFFAV